MNDDADFEKIGDYYRKAFGDTEAEKIIEYSKTELKHEEKIQWLRKDRYEQNDKGKWIIIVSSVFFDEKENRHVIGRDHEDLDAALRYVERSLCSQMSHAIENGAIILTIKRKSKTQEK